MIRADILEVLIVDLPLALPSSYPADFSPSPLQVTITILLLQSHILLRAFRCGNEELPKGNEVCTKSKTSFSAAARSPPCTSSSGRASSLPGLFKKIEQVVVLAARSLFYNHLLRQSRLLCQFWRVLLNNLEGW